MCAFGFPSGLVNPLKFFAVIVELHPLKVPITTTRASPLMKNLLIVSSLIFHLRY